MGILYIKKKKEKEKEKKKTLILRLFQEMTKNIYKWAPFYVKRRKF
jgi:hypothetical protein